MKAKIIGYILLVFTLILGVFICKYILFFVGLFDVGHIDEYAIIRGLIIIWGLNTLKDLSFILIKQDDKV